MNAPFEAPAFLTLAPSAPTDEEAEKAFRLLLRWLGEDCTREGLVETPQRAVRAWKEFFSGYAEDPRAYLNKTFEEVEGFQDLVCLEGIRLESYCEHHLVPIVGEAFIAYYPNKRVVGISKLARVMEGYARRLQIQEKLTAQIASALDEVLSPLGVAVALRAEHGCISMRGVHKPGATMTTVSMTGCFKEDPAKRAEFMAIVNRRAS